jgi:hypothetical protein
MQESRGGVSLLILSRRAVMGWRRRLIMPHTVTAAQVLDREFLTIRCKLLEVAAALDRIERGQGSAASDPRMEKIRATLAVLGKDGGQRAEQLQLIFSLPYEPAWRA